MPLSSERCARQDALWRSVALAGAVLATAAIACGCGASGSGGVAGGGSATTGMDGSAGADSSAAGDGPSGPSTSGSDAGDTTRDGATTRVADAGSDGAGGPAGDASLDGAPRDAAADASTLDAASRPAGDAAPDAPDGRAPEGGAPDGGTTTVLAGAPPMGWNSWNTFQCTLDETLIRGVADAMVSSGMQAAGYEYVNIDDCWMNGRDASGNLAWDATKFPSGIPALAAYVHGKGLKLGMYETPNTVTCVGIYAGISPAVAVGSLGHEAQDARTFAAWGVDFLKYDLCLGNRSSFATMRDALRATGRPIVYSINPGNGANDLFPPTTPGWDVVSIANMWRIAFDINASFASVTSILDQDAPFAGFAGPGHWNDADMLEVGKGMTADEDRSHFSMWAMLASPLLAGNDIRSMSTASHDILTNAEVIAVNQDPLGTQAQLAATPQTNLQIWSKTLSGPNTRAVALLNRTAASASITVSWATLGLPAGSATVRDLWAHADLGAFVQGYTATAIPSHGVVVLKVVSAN
jgi:alpha-galactosidase